MLALALVELVGHFVVRARVPDHGDWHRAAEYVRSRFRDGDLIVSAPAWTDPLLRRVIGDRITPAMAGRSDLAPFERLWVLSIRGHRAPEEAGQSDPDDAHRFGQVLVRRWDLGPSPVIFDFTEHVMDAHVELVGQDASARPCPKQTSRTYGGGLGAGPLWPRERFRCDPRRGWLWVGETITEDLALRPRRCIWQHAPAPGEVMRTTFRDVPRGDRIVLYAGLYYEHERHEAGGDIAVRLLVDGEEVGRMAHHDGDGWLRMEAVPVAADAARRTGEVAVEVSATHPHQRSLCWAATSRVVLARPASDRAVGQGRAR